jgi:hypothetical protein
LTKSVIYLVGALTVIATASASHLQAATSSISGVPPSERKLVPPGGYDAFCGGAPDCPPGHVPARLRRRLRLPTLGAHARCPVSAPGKTVSPDFAPAIGDGPLYAISFFSLAQTGILPFDYPPKPHGLFGGSSWGGQVLKWLGGPSYGGPVLIRGRRLYDRYPLGFGSGTFFAYSEMQLPPGQGDPQVGGWRGWPGYARLRRPGCYGLRVDGTNFSEAIVFKAVLNRHAG